MKTTLQAFEPTDWREQLLYDALVKSCPHPLTPPVHDELVKLADKRLTALGMDAMNLKMMWTVINAGLKDAGKRPVAVATQAACDTVGECQAAIFVVAPGAPIMVTP